MRCIQVLLAWLAGRRQNLVILNRWFVLRASRSDRYRFWRAYRHHRQLGKGCAPLRSREGLDLADEVETYTLASNLALWKRRDRRCSENNRYYRRVETAGRADMSSSTWTPNC